MNEMQLPRENDLPLEDDLSTYHPDAGWHWHDAGLIVFERRDANRSEYAVGAVDLYANALTGDLGGSYLELGAFDNLDRAADLYGKLQSTIDDQMLLPFQLADYLENQAQQRDKNLAWRTASPMEYAAYEAVRSLEFDEPEIEIGYRFASGISEDGEPALQAVKSWHENGEPHEARRTLDTYGMSDEAEVVARELNGLAETDGLEQAMSLAANIATMSGYLQPERETHLFSEGPPDRFTADQAKDPVQEFQDAFADGNSRLLEPVDPAVNYSFDITEPDPWTMELRANKWWFGQDGVLHNDGLALNSYSLDSFEFERESEREIAAMDREGLAQTHREGGLEASMRQAEAKAIANGELDPNREDGRLFYEGPPDRFTTLRELQLAGREHEADMPHRDEWQELLDRADNDKPDPEPHYWLIQHQAVETPDGQRLGTAMVMLEFPQLTPDFGKYLEEHGIDEAVYPTEARRLEVAHFADENASKKFEAEFRSYLVPGVIDGPELAPEVAQLEGLSGEWETLGVQAIATHMSAEQAVVKDKMEWQFHRPNAGHKVDYRFELPSGEIDF